MFHSSTAGAAAVAFAPSFHASHLIPSSARLLSARPGLLSASRLFRHCLPLRQQSAGSTGRRFLSVPSAAQSVSTDVLQESDDEGSYDDDSDDDFNLTPKKGQTFADTLSEEDDLIQIDGSLDVADDPALLVSNPDFSLSRDTVDAVNAKGIDSLFPIQAAVLKPAMEGRDLIGRARTGSGKTLAFALPVVEKINLVKRAKHGRPPLCLVLAPTRELASQVEREFNSVAPRLYTSCFFGGTSIQNQIRELRRGVDVVVGTPGRVIDLINRGELDLSQVAHVILDEADEMLAVGFCDDVEEILETVPQERQTLLFSATLPHWVTQVTKRFLTDPVVVDTISESETGRMSDTITALACSVSRDAKNSVLVDLISVHGKGQKTIVFTQTKRECDEVSASLSRQFPCEALHGDISQDLRTKTLTRFRDGRINVLVATDVAARGLDIPNVDLVVHYTLPQEPESFLHRSGRTGRAGRKGTAITLLGPSDQRAFQDILRRTKTKVNMVAPPSPDEVMKAASLAVANRLDMLDPEVIKFFEPTAERLLQVQDPHHCLAASLAALSGYTEVPKPRSLITQEEGVQTLRLMAEGERLPAPGAVLGTLCSFEEGAGTWVGRIRMLREDDKQGAVFDVPFEHSKRLLAHAGELASQGLTLDIPKVVPMDAVDRRGDRRGGGRNRRGGGGNWGRNDRRGGGGGYNRGGGYGGDRNDRRGGGNWGGNNRGNYSSNRGGRRGSGGWNNDGW